MNIEQLILEEYTKIHESSLLTENKVGPPLDAKLTVSSEFGPRRGRQHDGTDFDTPVGTKAISVLPGTVTYANNLRGNACGGTIQITHKNGFQSTYCHMSKFDVKKGDTVTLGQVVGETGGKIGAPMAGNSNGPHLHFGLRLNGKYVNPELYISKTIKPPPDISKLMPGVKDYDPIPEPEDHWGAIDYFQTVLDFAGFIPGYGDVIDIINAALYFGRGKYVDGFLSLIAVIPVVGSFMKFGLKATFKSFGMGKVARAMRKAMRGAHGDMQKLWVTMLKDGHIDAATLKQLAKHGDTVASMLRSSAGKLKKLDKYGVPIPDAAYKQMDEIADAIKHIVPQEPVLSTIAKVAKATGKVTGTVAKGTYNVTKKIIGIPFRLVLSPITIPIAMTKASIRVVTGKTGMGATSLIKRFVGKSGDNIGDMERAVRVLFKKKLAANPLLLANMIKTNGSSIALTKAFKNLDGPTKKVLKDLHTKPTKEIEQTLNSLLQPKMQKRLTNFSPTDYKNLVGEVTDQAAARGNPYYNTFIKDEVINWSVAKSPGLKLSGAWDSKAWYDWPNTKGVKTLDVISNEIQDAAEKLGLEDTDDPQGVILQSLVIALRYAGALTDENVETIKDFTKTYVKPIYSGLKQQISHYATMENAKEGARLFKHHTYHQIPGLDDAGKETDAASATASQKWNYLSTHASEFASGTWSALTMMWDVIVP